MQILVSVIIPIYNVEKYLKECIDSVVNQTLREIEIICIDDGSTDSSVKILKKYADNDNRIIILHQSNKGAGAARNKGIEIASGKYLSFLDSDDFFEKDLLAKSYAVAEKRNADIVIYNTKTFSDTKKQIEDGYLTFKNHTFPTKLIFTYHDIQIIDSLGNCAWNKLFLRDLIIKNDIRFPEIKRAEDLYFSYAAITSAARLTLLYDVLVYYRTGITTNHQSTNHEAPLDFYIAITALKERFVKLNIFQDIERWYINFLLNSCLYNLHTLNNPVAFNFLYNKIRNEIIPNNNLLEKTKEYFYFEEHFFLMNEIIQNDDYEYLFKKYINLKSEFIKLKKTKTIELTISSQSKEKSFWLIKKYKRFIRHLQNDGFRTTMKLTFLKIKNKIRNIKNV